MLINFDSGETQWITVPFKPCLHPKHFNYNEFLSIPISWHNIKGKLLEEIPTEHG